MNIFTPVEMILDSMDDDSESDFLSLGAHDLDVDSNHYRIPKLNNYGVDGTKSISKSRGNRDQVKYNNEGKIMSLTELAAQKVACHLPFGQVEHFDPPVPEPMQCRIAFWSFPQDEEDVRLYTCLANGNADIFIRAEDLISLNCVCDMLQVGFHLSANVRSIQDVLDFSRVAITFDRRRITSCSCSCSASTFWCQHAVAVCLQRIRKPQEVTLRAPVSESLQRLEKNQLQKFAQYLINELPQQILPAAQKLLDELLSGEEAVINQNPAAPDPTAGATINEQTSWCLDDTHLSMDIQKILLKQCTAQPTVCSDIQSLHTTAPPAATEYSQLLRPIRGREPEGLWNLISIVGEMMRRRDSNFFLLLEIMTEEVLKCDKIVTWWFETKVSLHSGSTIHYSTTKNNLQCTSQYSCSNFCDEIVHLWRLAAMNPSANPPEHKRLYKKFYDWHLEILEKHSAHPNKRNFLELFPGFKPAMEGCLIDWSDWDDKRDKLVDPVNNLAAEKTKSSKSAKKKKKKSKASKQNSVDQKPTTSNESNDIKDPIDAENQPPTEHVHVADPGPSRIEDQKDDDAAERAVEQRDELLGDNNVEAHAPLRELNQVNPPDEAPLNNAAPMIEQDLQVYFMDRRAESPQKAPKPESLEDFIKVNYRKLNDPLETIYAKAEGLYAHGYLEEARKLAYKAAIDILNYPNYPSLKQLYNLPRRKKKKGSLDNQMSIVVSEALTKIAFLCSILIDDLENHNLVFRLALFGVELKRSPAATKPLEVKLINQQHDLMTLLKGITLHEEELVVLREKARALRASSSDCGSNALTTLILGNFLFEVLVLSRSSALTGGNPRAVENSRSGSTSSYNQSGQYQLEDHFLQPGDMNQPANSLSGDQLRQSCSMVVHGKSPLDSTLGFNAALSALSVKVNLLEVDHPLLCEGTRRQRGELAISLLTHYKDDQEKLDLILKHLFDQDVVMSQAPSNEPEQSPKARAIVTQDPNQPTEASAHFMFELAKTVFDKAGGNSMTAHLFRPQLNTQNGGRGIQRRLHMCTLRIALHALGLQNRASIGWMQRTYNGRAAFILEQALEIGLPAIKFLGEHWEGYMTPVEVASIADKAGCSNDLETKRVAAEMAKSCLKYANNLEFNAVKRILAQCKEQSIEMIEEACGEIERVAEKDSVCADVLFTTAKAWYSLYEKLVMEESLIEGNCCPLRDTLPSEQDTGVASWSVTSNSHQDKYPMFNEQIQIRNWDLYAQTKYTLTHKHVEYVEAAYRVGMKALDALKPPLHASSKHTIKKEEDVLWLLGLSKSLGREALHKFIRGAIMNIANPQVLSSICKDLMKFYGPLSGDEPDRIHILLPLIEKCLDRYVRQTRDLLKHISYDSRSIVDNNIEVAQTLTDVAYTLTAAGYFKEILRIVESRKSKKFRVGIETRARTMWVDQLISTLKSCLCAKCRIARDISLMSCNSN